MRYYRVPQMVGQWVGYYILGPEYGLINVGEKVEFRFFIEQNIDGQFSGTSVDYDGYGANFETARIQGFIDGDLISINKEYKDHLIIDEVGHTFIDNNSPKPKIHYTGTYNFNTKRFEGMFEVICNDIPFGDGYLVEVLTGNWEAWKDIS